MMCRHLLPRFDLPLGQTLHGLGRFAVAHPASTAAVILLPFCAAAVVMIFREVRSPVAARWRTLGPALAHRPSDLIDEGFGPAHSG